ncbi:putative acyl-coenzyme A synthetase [Staphylotrichum tortipilum]|uniref:Acyl-coenzyme A synthetase n=1 Tax=Staphylotrichum tortipilum TaxID=2831512 RepID=A0AAN6RRK4_9PEZI|nr:putative acyl-coenzyme A synthetase [Staphylotrichum longicolle]
MTTIVQRTSSGIIYKPAEDRDYPRLDLLTLLFDSDLCGANDDTVLHADAADPTKSVTKAQLRGLVERTAHTLRHQYGIGQHGPSQDAVLAICTGHWLLPNLFYSTIAADGIFSASNPGSTPKELATQLTQVSVKLLFCTEDTKPTALAAAKLANLPLSRVLCLPPASTTPTFQLISQSTLQPIPLSTTPHPWRRLTSPSDLTTTTICLLFSSGTTGPPKACRLSHTNMVSEATLVIDENRAHYTRRGLPQPPYRTIAHLPAAHIAGIQGYFVNPFYTGGPVYWMPRFDLPLFLKYAKRYRMTNFFSVPPVFLAIAKSPLVTDQFDSVETAVSGAAPMGRELQAAAQRKLGRGKAQLSQTWGLSETTGSMTLLPVGAGQDWTGSVSQLLGSTRMRIVDEEDKDVEPGTEGEIWVRGPQVTEGYFGNEAANKEAFVDGWFRTGDVGLVKGGLLYIVDRKKELIKYKGNQVAPAELEALLVSHPKILDAAAIGVDSNDTEVPRAYVVADPKQVTAEEIIEWVAGQVSNHKRLRGGVVFLPAIPKSPSGKILRKDLRALAKKQAGKSKL